jgi:plasmid stability protein
MARLHFGTILEEALMATLTIKNVPEKLHRRLKQSAAEHRRSVNGEVIACLERQLMSRRVDPEEFLEEVRQLRERLAAKTGIFVTDKDLREAKNWGRP